MFFTKGCGYRELSNEVSYDLPLHIRKLFNIDPHSPKIDLHFGTFHGVENNLVKIDAYEI